MLLSQLSLHATESPDRVAVVAAQEKLTYEQLHQRASHIAKLCYETGIPRGSMVAIFLGRTVDAVAAIVGVMLAGMAYTVVEDEGQMDEHIFRIKTIAPAFVVTDLARLAVLVANDIVAIAIETPNSEAGPSTIPMVTENDLAYVLFTSGSTGVPKGVMITHGNLAAYTTGVKARLDVSGPLTYAHVSTLAADLGNTSLMLSLWTGGTLHLIDGVIRKDPSALFDYLASNQIQFLKITPSHWQAMFKAALHEAVSDWTLDYLVLGGEALSLTLAAETLHTGLVRRLVNHYGPTETTVGVMANVLQTTGDLAGCTSKTVPIGRPFNQVQALIRSADGVFHHRDMIGELYIGGPSVSPGYFKNPDATEKNFVRPGDADQRLYKTGDKVRVDGQGVIEFLGRVDRQVKVNGYRVELEHVETALKSLEGVDAAFAVLLEIDGKSAIAAAVLTSAEALPTLKTRLAKIVPHYVVPKWIERFDRFPLNANGKTNVSELRTKLEERLTKGRSEDALASASPKSDSILPIVRDVWKGALKKVHFSDNDDFFAVGGDSLDAIQVIAELQGKGFRVSANAFLCKPTITALCASIVESEKGGVEKTDKTIGNGISNDFSAAQEKFLHQNFAQADHYNQTLLLESTAPLSIEILRKTTRVLQEWHPLLATRYWKDGGRWVSQRTESHPVVGLSSIDALSEDEAVAALIKTASQVYQSTLSLNGGKVFAAHLFTKENGPHQLLLVAHHLSIDVISWRVILHDFSRVYRIIERGETIPESPKVTPLSAWVAHLREHRAAWEGDTRYWDPLLSAEGSALPQEGLTESTNLEESAATAWLHFTAVDTQALLAELPAKCRTHFHHVFLAAFMQVWHDADPSGNRRTLVEIESHGRISFDERIDISRTAGWFTSSFPVQISTAFDNLEKNAQAVGEQLHMVPHLGIAYGMQEASLGAECGGPVNPKICFNYLGEFHFDDSEHPSLRPSRYSPGVARGGENRRTHELKLTARIVGGQLLVDLNFAATAHERDFIQGLLVTLRERLLSAAGKVSDDVNIYIERGSSSGLLINAPLAMYRPAVMAPTMPERRSYKQVLLTGASGYLGIYAFYELLSSTNVHVFCLVRDEAEVSAASRLTSIFNWYFPEVALFAFRDRFTVICGDFDIDRMGLDEALYSRLLDEIDAIYHFAADTRLFADQATLHRRNVDGTRQALLFASKGRKKDFHHMSTLAVCGVNVDGGKRSFAEHDLDIGQAFLNDYERSKFKAERLVQGFIAEGGNGFIYRTGNVSGHSLTGKFQRNGADNRFVQLIRALIKIGKRPAQVSETINLSPVDVVVQSIVSLSLETGLPSRTFHIDSPWDISFDEVIDALEAVSGELTSTSHRTFAGLFAEERLSRDRDLLLGNFWANRAERNILVDATRTRACMEKLDCRFEILGRDWLEKFLLSLANDGALSDLDFGKVVQEK